MLALVNLQNMKKPIPVVDLFSGPGGLAEGFARHQTNEGKSRFEIALSVEMDKVAHRTLRLRAFLRKFREFPKEYYEFMNGLLPEEPDWATLYPEEWTKSGYETPCVKLGTAEASRLVRKRVQKIRNEHGTRAVLLGGPPCQSYSVAGRARNAGNPNYDIFADERVSLYKEYAKVLGWLQPWIAVMENVKGMLSAQFDNKSVFNDVMKALQNAGGKNRYELFALTPVSGRYSWSDGLEPRDFLVQAEKHGVPQRRHRVFVICIRKDVIATMPERILPKLSPHEEQVTVHDVIGNMPLLRSRLSRGDSDSSWQAAVEDAYCLVNRNIPEMSQRKEIEFQHEIDLALKSTRTEPLPFRDLTVSGSFDLTSCPDSLQHWFYDENLKRLPNNETRGHIRGDLGRYLFAAAFARVFETSPRTAQFPMELAPTHANWTTGKFADRFRVQLAHLPSTTVTSHISKDGHYFIHPDPCQCRSLTVREAARLQTFPDNYFFHGGRTHQYIQVGNAVPPYLAHQIAEQVLEVVRHHDQLFQRSVLTQLKDSGNCHRHVH